MKTLVVSVLVMITTVFNVNFSHYASTPQPTPTPQATATPVPAEKEGLSDLKNQIQSIISSKDGDWSVYAKNLKTNEFLSINEHSMPSASLIKLFIMCATYKNINNGTLKKDDNINGLLKNMITVSDNDAANELCTILGDGDMLKGFEVENTVTKDNKCTFTKQQTDLQDNRANSKIPFIGRNYTSTHDCGHILELIYRKKLYSEQISNEMLDLLKHQEIKHKIPYVIPKNIVTANKTGEMSGVENDASIIFAPNCDYILVVMSDALPNNEKGISVVQDISRCVYNYFSQKPTPTPTPKIEHKTPEILPKRK